VISADGGAGRIDFNTDLLRTEDSFDKYQYYEKNGVLREALWAAMRAVVSIRKSARESI
jgi:hypothetical protein